MTMIDKISHATPYPDLDTRRSPHDNACKIRRCNSHDSVTLKINRDLLNGQTNAFAARYFEAMYQDKYDVSAMSFLDIQFAQFLSTEHSCEVFFCFSAGSSLTDGLIFKAPGDHGIGGLQVTRSLQFALGKLGFQIGEYRNRSSNKRPALEYLQRSARCRQSPILTWEQLEALIDRTDSAAFLICLYAIVPLSALIGLDLRRKITFANCRIVTIDPESGAFQHLDPGKAVTVSPTDGRFFAAWSCLCSPVLSGSIQHKSFHGALRNLPLGS